MKRIAALCLFVPSLAGAATAPATFDPNAAGGEPWFSTDRGPCAEASRRFRVEDWAGAARGFHDCLAGPAKGAKDGAAEPAVPRPQAAFLEAYALFKAGRFDEAAKLFGELPRTYPLLADYQHFFAARALFGAKRYDKALAAARLVDKTSPLAGETRLVRADSLRMLKQSVEAEKEYRAYLLAYPGSWRAHEARFRVAEQLDARGKWPEARELYTQVWVQAPTESWAKLAEARLRAVDKKAPELGAAQHLARGMALFDQMRNAESEAELKAALAGSGLTATQQCEAAYNLAQSVFKQRDRPRAAPLFDAAAATCEKAPHESAEASDLHAKSLYQGARCHAAKDEVGAAMRCYVRIEQEHPGHSYADDARLRESELINAAIDLVKSGSPIPADKRAHFADLVPSPAAATDELVKQLTARYEELLGAIPDRYPTGDQGGEALFRLGFRDWKDGKIDEARAHLERELAAYPREDCWWEAGRTLYWLGRIAERQGKPDEAKQRWTACARTYPLAYYTLAALNRLRERSPDEAARVVDELHAPAPTPDDLRWAFAASPVFGEAGFRRAVELMRLGLGGEAKRELAALGIKPPEKKGAKVDSPEREQLLWLAAVLYDRGGLWSLSHFIPRHVLTAFAQKWPSGDNRKRWLLSFPRGYGDLVVEHAGKNGQPAALQFAIIREESAFDPLDESFANAVGLTQLTQPPAKRFAQGLPYSREALHDPVINVTIGARELGDLWKRSHNDPALTIAGYNAGDGAVRRWLKAARPGTTLDEFVENIPFDETRGYTKRVLGSWFTYHWLYEKGDAVPPLPQTLRSY